MFINITSFLEFDRRIKEIAISDVWHRVTRKMRSPGAGSGDGKEKVVVRNMTHMLRYECWIINFDLDSTCYS